MKGLIFSATPFSFPFYIFLFLITRLSSLDGVATNLYASCSNVFSCGTITGVDYPFYGGDRPAECGHPGLELDCDDDIITTIEIMNVKYRVLAINQDTQVVTITREDLSEDICLEEFVNTTLDSRLFEYASEYKNLTFLYGCPPSGPATAGQFNCPVNGISYSDGYVQIGAQGPGLTCHASVVVPIKNTSFEGIGSLGDVLAQGFEVGCKVDNTACTQCKNSSGQCGYDQNLNKFKCLCANQSSASETCLRLETDPRPPQSPELSERPKKPERPGRTEGSSQKPLPDTAKSESESESKSATSKNEKPLRVGLGVAGAIVAGIGIGFSIFFYKQRRKKVAAQAALALQTESKDLKTIPSNKPLISPPPNAFTKSIPPYPSPKSDLGRGSTYFGVQVFSYSDLELATDNFHPSRELGDGGFGAVYHGTLPDGRVVAVKRLYENNFKRVEQFMNEVEILARLRHKNLVQLYGCTSKKSQGLLLVYEFIPNGTVADHLHGKRANSGLLSWSIRMNIAVETAEALAYLHASDIIHRDVKTTNILLDNGFHVKVADFGLSRLFPTNVTHVSTAPQGTPGYVDPEYYQCYQLTEKSDVYSFGVVLIELISSLQAVDTNRHRQDINLANMAVNKIQNHALNDLVDRSLGFETNSSVRRMATQVAGLAFRCLQQERDARPSMQEVLEALRGVQNEELNAQKAEVVEIVVDDVALLKGHIDTPSPDSVGTSKGVNSSTSDSI